MRAWLSFGPRIGAEFTDLVGLPPKDATFLQHFWPWSFDQPWTLACEVARFRRYEILLKRLT